MDVFSHSLWGGLFFGRKNKFLLAMLFGVLPDLIAFTPHFIVRAISGNIFLGKPSASDFPSWVFSVYNLTHSFITAAVLFLMIRYFYRKLSTAFLAWPLHILFDIPTHQADFFPTEFLYPLSTFHFSGISWANKYFLLADFLSLAVIYFMYFYKRSLSNKNQLHNS